MIYGGEWVELVSISSDLVLGIKRIPLRRVGQGLTINISITCRELMTGEFGSEGYGLGKLLRC